MSSFRGVSRPKECKLKDASFRHQVGQNVEWRSTARVLGLTTTRLVFPARESDKVDTTMRSADCF